MALSMEVGLRPSHIVLDGDPAPLPKKGAELPQFSADFYSELQCSQISIEQAAATNTNYTCPLAKAA